MGQHASLSARAIGRRIERDQTTFHKPTILQQLETALSVAEGMTRYALNHDLGDMWYRGYRQELEYAEQIAMVKELTGAR